MALLHRKTNGRRGVPKAKRLALPEIKELAEDAPLGSYLIDTIAEELFSRSTTCGSKNEFVRRVRQKINSAGTSAATIATDRYTRHPDRFFRGKRFFTDLNLIRKLIERNKNMDRSDLLRTTKRVLNRNDLLLVTAVPKAQTDEIDDLMATLPRMAEVIAVFLRRNKLQGKGGNHDPLTRVFIDEVFVLWRELYWVEESADESRLFVRLLVAAWRDFNFPTREEDGQSLEEWLADRVRKQFPDGIGRTRLSEQYEKTLRAYERSGFS